VADSSGLGFIISNRYWTSNATRTWRNDDFICHIQYTVRPSLYLITMSFSGPPGTQLLKSTRYEEGDEEGEEEVNVLSPNDEHTFYPEQI